MNWKAAPLLNKAFAGNECYVKDRESCWKEYELLFTSNGYVHCQNARTAPDSERFVQQLLKEAPAAKRKGQLAIVTGVTVNGVGYYIGRELAVQAEMHVILLGKSEGSLQKCIQAIQNYSKTKGYVRDDDDECDLILYKHKYHLASLDSVKTAADFCIEIAQQEQYQGKLAVLVNQASVGSAQAKLTQQGIEYNTGCNFVATHYFITNLLPLLQQAATEDYKPRVASIASIGHALGRNFQPYRMVHHPKEGGAPPGYIVVQSDGTIREYEHSAEADNNIDRNSSSDQGAMSVSSFASRLKQYWPKMQKVAPPAPEHLAKVGTQVGRSKMAIVADTIYLAGLYPQISFSTYHAGATSHPSQSIMATPSELVQQYVGNYYSNSQAARAALRAALDPHMNSVTDLMGGVYLHADGNPWTPMEPCVKNPSTGENYHMIDYAKACHDAVTELLEKILQAKTDCTTK